MMTKHDLKPGVKFTICGENIVRTILSTCKSINDYSIAILYEYEISDEVFFNSVVIDKEILDCMKLEDES